MSDIFTFERALAGQFGWIPPWEILCDQRLHYRVELILRLEADAGAVGELEITILDSGIIGKAGKHAEHIGIRFAPAQAEAADDRQSHLVAAVREDRMALPLVALQHVEGA